MVRYLTPLVAAAGLLAIGSLPSEASAQSVGNSVCMGKQTQDATGRPFALRVSPGKRTYLEARGFAEQPCPEGTQRLPQFRKDICKFAATGGPELTGQFQQIYGISPAEICALTTEILDDEDE